MTFNRNLARGEVLEVVGKFLNSNLPVFKTLTTPQPLISIKRKAIRKGVWWLVSPFKRALIDVAIMYLRGGRVVRAPSLLSMVREVLLELLTYILSLNLKFVAILIGRRLIDKFSGLTQRVLDLRYALALGIQWLSKPLIYREAGL